MKPTTKQLILTIAQIGLIPIALVGVWLEPSWILLSIPVWFVMTVSITAVYHRYYAHKGYKMSIFWQAFGAIAGFLGNYSTPVEWVAQHKAHHVYCDTPGDPHSPKLLGKKVLLYSNHGLAKVSTASLRLMRDPVARFIQNHQLAILLTYITTCYVIAGWRGVMFLWAIPSVASLWATIYGICNHNDEGAGSFGWFNAIITCGEQHHDDHHKDPSDWSRDWPASWIIKMVRS